MPDPVSLYDSSHRRFQLDARARVRRETYDKHFGQIGWLTAEGWRAFIGRLELDADATVLDVACGSRGPALFLARTRGVSVTGADVSEAGIATATRTAQSIGLAHRARFDVVDAARRLPFDGESFGSIVCIDAINHLDDRIAVLEDWYRLHDRTAACSSSTIGRRAFPRSGASPSLPHRFGCMLPALALGLREVIRATPLLHVTHNGVVIATHARRHLLEHDDKMDRRSAASRPSTIS